MQNAGSLAESSPASSLTLDSIEAFTDSTSHAIDKQLFELLMKEVGAAHTAFFYQSSLPYVLTSAILQLRCF